MALGPEDKARFLDEVRANKFESFRTLGAQYGITRNAAIGLAHRAGLRRPIVRAKPKAPPPPKRLKLVRLMPIHEIEPSLPIVNTKPVSFLEFDHRTMCGWIVSESPTTYCGRPRFVSGPYCAQHHKEGVSAAPQRTRSVTPWRGR